MSGMPRVCNVAALVCMTMTHDCMSPTTCQCELVLVCRWPVLTLSQWPETACLQQQLDSAPPALASTGPGTGPRQVLLASSRQNGAGTSQGCAVTLVRTVEASIKTLWLRIRRNKVFISSNPENLIAATSYWCWCNHGYSYSFIHPLIRLIRVNWETMQMTESLGCVDLSIDYWLQ